MNLTTKRIDDRRWNRWVDGVFGVGEEVGTHELLERLKEEKHQNIPTITELSRYLKRSNKYEYVKTDSMNRYYRDELSNPDLKYRHYNYRNYRIAIYKRVG